MLQNTHRPILNHLGWFKIDFQKSEKSCADIWTSKPYLSKRSGGKLHMVPYFILRKGLVLSTCGHFKLSRLWSSKNAIFRENVKSNEGSSKKSLKKSIFRLKNVLFQITICGHKWHKYVPGVPQNTYKPILNHLGWFKTDFKKSNSSHSKRFFKAVFGCILATFSHLGEKWEVVCRHMNK